MSDSPQKYLLPTGPELRDIIRRRIESQPMSAPALWASLNYGYQTRPRQEQSVIDAVAGMLTDGELEQRGCELHVAEPEPAVAEIPAEMWTMTQTARLLSVLTDETRTRAWLAEATGLKPKQVSKAMNHLIGQGKAEVVGDVPRTWRRTEEMDAERPVETEPERAMLTEAQTRDVVLDRVGYGVCLAEPLLADVMRLSGWDKRGAETLIENMLIEGDLSPRPDGSINRPLVKSEDPPTYEIGDDDDGEITEPGIARPEAPAFSPDSVTVTFVKRDSSGYITGEHCITIDADGLHFDGEFVAMSFATIDAVMPVLRRVHRAVFGDGD